MNIMIKIGITGGIGSGKSVVATLFRLFGVPVYIADEESKQLTNQSETIRKQLIAHYEEAIYTPEGLNKPLLAAKIFQDPAQLRIVNGIIHPEVKRHFEAWAAKQTTPLCAIESAILFESGFDKVVDTSLMVYAPKALRIERATARDAASREAIQRRIESQMADEEKRKLADHLIYNDDQQPLIPQVTAFLARLLDKGNTF